MVHGPRRLRDCHATDGWPPHGVYFFFEPGEVRADRSYIERNSIALTSHLAQGPDPPSPRWLGRHADRTEIHESGLWNVDHVHHHCDTSFPGLLDQLIQHHQ
jgi:hypothetical protein